MHLNLDNTITAAGFASSAFYIEAETAFLVTSCLGICCRCKKISDLVKHSCVSGRVGTGSTPDRGLVNVDDFIKLVHSQNILMFARDHPRSV